MPTTTAAAVAATIATFVTSIAFFSVDMILHSALDCQITRWPDADMANQWQVCTLGTPGSLANGNMSWQSLSANQWSDRLKKDWHEFMSRW